MATWLKQSTARTIKLGPFVDETDGKTPETGLTISQADIRLSKNGAAFAQSNNAAGAAHDENGWYGVPLDTTDTGTLGGLVVAVYESGALLTWREFMVVPANVWDSMFGADKLQVDATQIEGSDATDQITAAATASLNTYDPPTKAEMDAGLAALNDIAASDVVTALTADGVAWDDFAAAVMAVLFGKASVSGSVVTYKKRDGTTGKVAVTHDASGNRTVSTLS